MLAEIFGTDSIVVIIVVAVVVLIGGARIPKIARSFGSAKGEFERGLKEGKPPSPSASEESAN